MPKDSHQLLKTHSQPSQQTQQKIRAGLRRAQCSGLLPPQPALCPPRRLRAPVNSAPSPRLVRARLGLALLAKLATCAPFAMTKQRQKMHRWAIIGKCVVSQV